MLITFKTKSYANITMFGNVGISLLKLMNFGSNVPGGIIASDVPEALENLRQGLAGIPDEIEPDKTPDDDEPTVSIHTRALPLIELLETAIADHNDIHWE